MYKEIVLDHYKRPRNEGTLRNADRTASGENDVCGDHVTWHANIEDSTVQEVAFTGDGCAISQATASMLSKEVEDTDTREVLSMGKDDVMDLLETELTPLRVKCAMLGLTTLQEALEDDTDGD